MSNNMLTEPVADVACESCGARYVIPTNVAPCACLECGARPVKSILYANREAMVDAVQAFRMVEAKAEYIGDTSNVTLSDSPPYACALSVWRFRRGNGEWRTVRGDALDWSRVDEDPRTPQHHVWKATVRDVDGTVLGELRLRWLDISFSFEEASAG